MRREEGTTMETGVASLVSADSSYQNANDLPFDIGAMERAARQRLEFHPHFRGRELGITIRSENSVLILSGKVPTFYLKQLAQEVLRDQLQVIQNDIEVVCCGGLSSAYSSTLHA
jgi:hypothetical protein